VPSVLGFPAFFQQRPADYFDHVHLITPDLAKMALICTTGGVLSGKSLEGLVSELKEFTAITSVCLPRIRSTR
jgi:hypothetical protein